MGLQGKAIFSGHCLSRLTGQGRRRGGSRQHGQNGDTVVGIKVYLESLTLSLVLLKRAFCDFFLKQIRFKFSNSLLFQKKYVFSLSQVLF